MDSSYGKKEELCGYKTIYRECAYHLMKLEQYDKALQYFDVGISKTPADKRTLMGRSAARSKICEYSGALEDIKNGLKLNETDLLILADKALNTYLSCNFEEGLIQNMRLLPLRKKPDSFARGIRHCRDAIENCVGERAGHPLRDHFKIVRELAWKKNFEAQRPYEPTTKHMKKKKIKEEKVQSINEAIVPLKSAKTMVCKKCPTKAEKSDDEEEEEKELNIDDFDRVAKTVSKNLKSTQMEDELGIRDTVYTPKSETNISPPKKKFLFKPLQNYTVNIANYMAEKYLDTMYNDKLYLKNLKTAPGVSSPNYQGTQKILQLAKFGYKSICYKQELLRTRRPFYFIKQQEAKSKGNLKLRQEAELRRIQIATKNQADDIVNKMKIAIKRKKLNNLLELAEKLKLFCDTTDKKLLPDRQMYLEIIYESVCQAHFNVKRLNPYQSEQDQEKRIYVMLDLPIGKEPSTDSVIAEYKGVIVDWKKQAALYGEHLRKASTFEEMAWLLHELSRFHLELKQFELARVYARKCISEGRRCNNLRWVINALILLIKIYIIQHNKNDAKVQAAEAIKTARLMDDQNLELFLIKCQEVIDNIQFDDVMGAKIVEKREQEIVEMMQATKLKDEVSHLFRKMSAMPASRRMSVMPGVHVEDDEEEEKPSSSRRLSIMPVKKSTSSVEFKTEKKVVKKDHEKRGIQFLELIQYHLE